MKRCVGSKVGPPTPNILLDCDLEEPKLLNFGRGRTASRILGCLTFERFSHLKQVQQCASVKLVYADTKPDAGERTLSTIANNRAAAGFSFY
jgi:hypothetical protein